MGLMRFIILAVAVSTASVVLASCARSQTTGFQSLPPLQSPTQLQSLPQMKDFEANGVRPECPPIAGQPECLVLTRQGIQPACFAADCGFSPKQLQDRYNLPITKGAGTTVAIVDAGDNPTASSDLAKYRSQFGLSQPHFEKYTQDGKKRGYSQYTGWSVEIDLDLEMVAASCPKCKVILVEANSAYSGDLETAELRAVQLGAHIVSNSWICYNSDFCVSSAYFVAKRVLFLAASGDAGFGEIGAPSVFDSVVAVGGTQLKQNGKHFHESIWSGSGGGCAFLIPKPKWQHDTICHGRADADASAEAGCYPGVAEYDKYDGGWFTVCGTSAATPFLGGVFALAGNYKDQDGGRTFWNPKHRADLYDVCLKSCRFSDYAWGGGWGSPSGTGAF